MSITCPKCQVPQQDENALYRHLGDVHRLSPAEIRRLVPSYGSGWREPQTSTPDGKVAIEHQEAALRAQMQKNRPLDIPMVTSPPPKQGMEIPAGWLKTNDRYLYQRTIYEAHTVDSIIKRILKGTVTVNHMEVAVFTYTKDVRKLTEMEDKARILEARLVAYVPSDPEFLSIASEIHNLKFRIAEHSKSLEPDIDSELCMEEFFRGEVGSDEHKHWQSEQMKRAIAEADRLENINRREQNKVV